MAVEGPSRPRAWATLPGPAQSWAGLHGFRRPSTVFQSRHHLRAADEHRHGHAFGPVTTFSIQCMRSRIEVGPAGGPT